MYIDESPNQRKGQIEVVILGQAETWSFSQHLPPWPLHRDAFSNPVTGSWNGGAHDLAGAPSNLHTLHGLGVQRQRRAHANGRVLPISVGRPLSGVFRCSIHSYAAFAPSAPHSHSPSQ